MKLFYFLSTILIFSCKIWGQTNAGYLTYDGAWCWFSDPRAVIIDNYIFTGWVKSDGSIEAAKFDVNTQICKADELYSKLEEDDHDNPGFVLTHDGKLIAMYTRHGKKDLFINALENINTGFDFAGAQLIHPLSNEELEKYPRETMTYANPIQLNAENNRLYCFGRWTGFKPNFMWSDDGGISWTKSKVIITNYPFDNNNRPYVKYFSDGISKIHIVFTDGHPRNEPTNSVYYAYYENGNFYKAGGQVICDIESIPFEPKDASIIYKSNAVEGRAWIADIGQDEQGNPIILYTKSPEETDHQYWYVRYTKNQWTNYKICDSGKWFPQTPEGEKEPEPHYFGGITVHPNNCNVIYLSRQLSGVFEIERWETNDSGRSWSKEAVTQNSKYDNVRPFIPRGLKAGQNEVVLWMENQKYIHYTNFKSSIKYHIRMK